MTQELSDKLFFEGISSLGLKPAVLEAIVDIHKIIYKEKILNEGVQSVRCFVAEFDDPEEAMEQEYNFRSAHGHEYDSFQVGNKVAVYPTECREKVEEFLGKPVVTKSVIHPWAGTTQLDSVLNEGVLNESVLGAVAKLLKVGLIVGAGVIAGQAWEKSNATHQSFPKELGKTVREKVKWLEDLGTSAEHAVVDVGKGYSGKTVVAKKQAPQKPIQRTPGK